MTDTESIPLPKIAISAARLLAERHKRERDEFQAAANELGTETLAVMGLDPESYDVDFTKGVAVPKVTQ